MFPEGESRFAEAFVKVSFEDDNEKEGDPLFGKWSHHGNGQHISPEITMTRALQQLYPKHTIVMTQDFRGSLLSFPASVVQPLSPKELVTNATFIPLARKGPIPGVIMDSVWYGAFRMAWREYDFILYILKWSNGFGTYSENFILHEGTEAPARLLLLEAGAYAEKLHNEIWVFNQGFWQKNAQLWQDVQSADWDDVILEEEFKTALQKDIYGFFSAEGTYKKLSLPWKRGIIMHGPPGNGKTISIKAIMKTCDAKGYAPMYVKSFKSYMGEEGSMLAVFNKARQISPCVLILEDLDALINDQNRSFFLNELDGLQGNDGLLVIGTTNHFDRLDPGLSTRPSRFDRKYLFDDPELPARLLYAQYWQGKLKDNEDIDYPDSLAQKIADSTEQFSFAYLKEAFVSSLVTLLTDKEDGKYTTFESAITSQIRTLRKQLDKSTETDVLASLPSVPSTVPVASVTYVDNDNDNSQYSNASDSAFVDALAAQFNHMHTAASESGYGDSTAPPASANGFTSATSERDIISVLHNFVQRIGGNSIIPAAGGVADDMGFAGNASSSLGQGGEDGFSMRRWM